MKTRLVAAVYVIAGFSGSARAQSGWVQAASTGPAGRSFHAIAYDVQRNSIVMFGGENAPQSWLGDTWELHNGTWGQVATAGPSARRGHAMAHDAVRGRTVLFGGSSSTIRALADTWEWDGATWTQVGVSGPSGRHQHAMTFDGQHARTVLFGGNTESGSGAPSNEAWMWDGTAWVTLPAGPQNVEGPRMIHDSRRDRIVLTGSSMTVGTWEFDGATWAPVAPFFGRAYHAIAYDQNRGKTVVFGGNLGSQQLGDTQEWDGSSWAQVASTGPTPRSYHALAYDSTRSRSILFGGQNGNGSYLSDLWEWTGEPGMATVFGNGCGNLPPTLSAVASAPPSIAGTAQAVLANIPSPLAFVALGWSNSLLGPFALPMPLVGYGMPGCFLLQSAEVAAQPVTFTSPTVATYSLPLPNWSGLIGLHVYLQGWAAAPGANAGNTIVSNGLDWAIGY